MIDVHKTPDLWTITLNRPDKANALSAAMLADLRDHLRAANDAGLAGLIVTGAGGVFSAGADLEEAKAGLAISPLWEEVSSALAAFKGLSIAALNGTVAGGANGMMLACDLRIAVPSTKIFYPVMRLGYLPQAADVPRLQALVGPARTKLILVAGAKITAAEALTFGLIDRIVPPEDLMTEALTLLADLRAGKVGHGAAIKAMIP